MMNIQLKSTRLPALAAILVTLCSIGSANAQTIKRGDIAPFEVVYSVGNNLITAGNATLSLKQEDAHWVYSLSTRPSGVFKLTGKGKISEVSTLNLVEQEDGIQLQSLDYRYRQDDERRRSVDAAFDWEARSLTFQKRGEEKTETFDDPVIDRLSVTLYVMNALRNGFDRLELQVFDNGEIKTVEFINEGTELLKTRLGELETIKVMNRKVGGSSRRTTTWFAPSLDYIPAKIEQVKRDELVARLSLTKLDNRVTTVDLPDTEKEVPPVADDNNSK